MGDYLRIERLEDLGRSLGKKQKPGLMVQMHVQVYTVSCNDASPVSQEVHCVDEARRVCFSNIVWRRKRLRGDQLQRILI
jgi:hypothetical protein